MTHTAVNQESPSWGTPSSCWKISFSYQEVIGKLITWNTSPKPNYLGCCDPLVLQSWWSFGFSSPKRHLLRSGQALSQSAKNKNTDFQGPFLIKTSLDALFSCFLRLCNVIKASPALRRGDLNTLFGKQGPPTKCVSSLSLIFHSTYATCCTFWAHLNTVTHSF